MSQNQNEWGKVFRAAVEETKGQEKISEDQIREWVIRARDYGDIDARNRVIMRNIGLLNDVALTFRKLRSRTERSRTWRSSRHNQGNRRI